jgi:hypothetical protein
VANHSLIAVRPHRCPERIQEPLGKRGDRRLTKLRGRHHSKHVVSLVEKDPKFLPERRIGDIRESPAIILGIGSNLRVLPIHFPICNVLYAVLSRVSIVFSACCLDNFTVDRRVPPSKNGTALRFLLALSHGAESDDMRRHEWLGHPFCIFPVDPGNVIAKRLFRASNRSNFRAQSLP